MAFSNLFSGSSSIDKCTFFSDRNLINRRNVKGDVSSAVNPCRQFFTLEVESRVIAAALYILGMTSITGNPTKNFPEDLPNSQKKIKKTYLHNLASMVVDTYVIDTTRNMSCLQAVQEAELRNETLINGPNAQGRFSCRKEGCSKTFAFNGKHRAKHEASHNPPVIITPPLSLAVNALSEDENRDDMLSYQKCLLEYGMLLMNFWDAINQGDGERCIRCWKFFLMYLRNEKESSTKYALEGLYLMFQINALLSPKSAHELIWNRTVNNRGRGGNIPLDLQLEFYNKTLKEAIKKLGPNASKNSLDRICHAMGTTRQLMLKFDDNSKVFRKSGRHTKKSTEADLRKVVEELVVNKALTFTPGRKYQYYSKMKSSILHGFDLQQYFHWISEHKKYMIFNRRAR